LRHETADSHEATGVGDSVGVVALTAKQQRFVDEYLIDLNATQAAIRAGYSARTAADIGRQLLRKTPVAERIQSAQTERAERTHITQDRVLQELARIAFFDPRKLFTTSGTPIDIQDLNDDVAAVLAGLDIVVERTEEGRDGYSSVRKYKLANKLGALEAAMRHLGMMKDRVELTGKDGGPIETADASRKLLDLLDRRAAAGASG
jgi:phage terminase small subunit